MSEDPMSEKTERAIQNSIDSAIRQWNELCARCQVVGGITVKFGAEPTGSTVGSTILLYARSDVEDSQSGRIIPIQTQDIISHFELVDARKLLRLARNLYAHEVTEQFRIDNVPAFDAHGEDRV